MSSYPDVIIVDGDELEFLVENSQLIETLYELKGNKGPLELSADLLFGSEDERTKEKKWRIFYDVLFPEEGAGKLFQVGKEKTSVIRNRGGKKAVKDMLDYLLIGTPETMWKFAKAQARKQINAPSAYVSTAPRAKGKISLNRRNYRNTNLDNNNDYNNNLYYNYNNNNNSNNTKIGYTEEEEKYLGKLPGTLAQQYYRNQRRASNRRTRKQNRKSRKTRRQNRK